MKAATRAALVTIVYWPFALAFVAFALMPECIAEVPTCESTTRITAVPIFGAEVALYAALLHLMLRKHRN